MPFMIDTVGDMRNRPLTVHATEATLEIIRAHIFNWAIWPDFSVIPTPDKPFMRFATIQVGETIDIDGRKVIPLPANHTVPAVGYQVDSGQGSLVFTGDTGPCPELWQYVNQIRNLRYLIIECAFSNSEKWLAQASLHLCPSMLLDELTNLQRDAEVFITHLKPGQIELTMQEIEDCIGEYRPGMLQNNQLFEI
jgi:cAMP phosphodiesterase